MSKEEPSPYENYTTKLNGRPWTNTLAWQNKRI